MDNGSNHYLDEGMTETLLLDNDERLSDEQFRKFLRDDVAALQRDINEVKAILEPLVPFMAALPELMGQVGPILEGLKKSPVLKMMGVSL